MANITPEEARVELSRRANEELKKRGVGRKRTALEYAMPSFMTPYEEKPGERTLMGDIFERPASAIRAGLIGREEKERYLPKESGYKYGSNYPEKIPTFQEMQLEKRMSRPYSGEPTSTLKELPGMIGASAKGMAMDVATNPADILSMLLGGKALDAIGKTRGGQAVGRFMTKERHLPHIMKRGKYTKTQAQTISDELEALRELIGTEKGKAVAKVAGKEVKGFKPDIPEKIYTKLKDPIYEIEFTESGAIKPTVGNLDKVKQAFGDMMSSKDWLEAGNLTKQKISQAYGNVAESIKKAAPEVSGDIEAYHQFMKRYPTVKKTVTTSKGEVAERPLRTAFKPGAEESTKESFRELSEMSPRLSEAVRNMRRFTGRQNLKKNVGKALIYGGPATIATGLLYKALSGRK